jgi:hypothetical protein
MVVRSRNHRQNWFMFHLRVRKDLIIIKLIEHPLPFNSTYLFAERGSGLASGVRVEEEEDNNQLRTNMHVCMINKRTRRSLRSLLYMLRQKCRIDKSADLLS